MDPLTHGLLGTTVAMGLASRKSVRVAALAGCLAALAPDLDVVISSASDPLVSLEYHRQFTHSLVFVPVWGALAAVLAMAVFRLRGRPEARFIHVFLGASAAALSHGVLDACTSYGTQLLWPFTDARIAWNNISIIDPIVTLPLLAAAVLACARKAPLAARVGFVFVVAYLCFGVVQRNAATEAAFAHAQARGHTPERLEVKPGFANLFVWRALYEHDDLFQVDAVRVGPGLETLVYSGGAVRKVTRAREIDPRLAGTRQEKDLERFGWFSDGFLARVDGAPNAVGDFRYSTLPNGTRPLWAMELTPEQPDAPLTWRTFRSARGEDVKALWAFISGAPEAAGAKARAYPSADP